MGWLAVEIWAGVGCAPMGTRDSIDSRWPQMDKKYMTFGQAIEQLKAGKRVARSGWNGKNMYLELQVPDAHSKMTLPYIYMRTVQADLVPWLASQTDMLSDDWNTVDSAT